MPCTESSLKEITDKGIWDYLADYDQKNYLVCISRNKTEDDQSNRNFAVISLHETNEHKIIKMRNPFEDFEWNGLFSDKSKLWTKELREELGFMKGDGDYIFIEA